LENFGGNTIFINKEYVMKRIIRLTESDLARIVKRVISERDFSPNVVKYDRGMRGGEDPFRNIRIPESKFNEEDIVTINRYEKEGEVVGVMFDKEKNQFIYQVRSELPGGKKYTAKFTEDELS
jgi:hypothetical protein